MHIVLLKLNWPYVNISTASDKAYFKQILKALFVCVAIQQVHAHRKHNFAEFIPRLNSCNEFDAAHTMYAVWLSSGAKFEAFLLSQSTSLPFQKRKW